MTAEHPLWSLDDGDWEEAGDLELGERIDTLHGPVRLISAAQEPGRANVYNFEVGDSHTYFVGDAGIWARNSCRGLWQITKEGTEQVMRHGRFGVQAESSRRVAVVVEGPGRTLRICVEGIQGGV